MDHITALKKRHNTGQSAPNNVRNVFQCNAHLVQEDDGGDGLLRKLTHLLQPYSMR